MLRAKLPVVLLSFLLTLSVSLIPSTGALVEEPPDREVLEWERWDAAPIALQAALGAVGAVGAGLLGLLSAIPSDIDEGGSTTGPLVGAAVGVTLGATLGIGVGGHVLDGDGSWLATLAGSALGAAIAFPVGYAIWDEFEGAGTTSTVAGGVLILGGGIVGYHLTSSEFIPAISVAPTDGGAHMGMTVTF